LVKTYQIGKNVINDHKLYHTAINYTNGHRIYQQLTIKGPPKFTQIGIFGLKTNHLATMVYNTDPWSSHQEPLNNPSRNFSEMKQRNSELAADWRKAGSVIFRQTGVPGAIDGRPVFPRTREQPISVPPFVGRHGFFTVT
jgi:hypothetical protein